MRKLSILILAFGIIFTLGAGGAMAGNGQGNYMHYFYQWMADDDGDGIPNGQDEDWEGPADGTGFQRQNENQNSFGDFLQNKFQQQQQQKTEAGFLDRVRQRLQDGSCSDE